MPNLERDLGRSFAAEMQSAHSMVDNMLAPSVFAYTAGKGSAFQASAQRQAPALHKVDLQISAKGLFADREAWH